MHNGFSIESRLHDIKICHDIFVVFLAFIISIPYGLWPAIFPPILYCLWQISKNTPTVDIFRRGKHHAKIHVRKRTGDIFAIRLLWIKIISAPTSFNQDSKIDSHKATHELGHLARHDLFVITFAISMIFAFFLKSMLMLARSLNEIFKIEYESEEQKDIFGFFLYDDLFGHAFANFFVTIAAEDLFICLCLCFALRGIVYRREFISDAFAYVVDHSYLTDFIKPRARLDAMISEKSKLVKHWNNFAHPTFTARELSLKNNSVFFKDYIYFSLWAGIIFALLAPLKLSFMSILTGFDRLLFPTFGTEFNFGTLFIAQKTGFGPYDIKVAFLILCHLLVYGFIGWSFAKAHNINHALRLQNITKLSFAYILGFSVYKALSNTGFFISEIYIGNYDISAEIKETMFSIITISVAFAIIIIMTLFLKSLTKLPLLMVVISTMILSSADLSLFIFEEGIHGEGADDDPQFVKTLTSLGVSYRSIGAGFSLIFFGGIASLVAVVFETAYRITLALNRVRLFLFSR